MTDQLNYHMKLHYSQTGTPNTSKQSLLNYHMKLHYSQTGDSGTGTGF